MYPVVILENKMLRATAKTHKSSCVQESTYLTRKVNNTIRNSKFLEKPITLNFKGKSEIPKLFRSKKLQVPLM